MTDKPRQSNEILDDLFEDKDNYCDVNVDDLLITEEKEGVFLVPETPLTEEQLYEAAILRLSDFCKQDKTYILIPLQIETNGQKQLTFQEKELESATDIEIVAWAKYVCPSLDLSELPKLVGKKDRVTIFEMVITYMVAIGKSWKALTSSSSNSGSRR